MKKLLAAVAAVLVISTLAAEAKPGGGFGGGARSSFSSGGGKSTPSGVPSIKLAPSAPKTSVPSVGSRDAAPTPATGGGTAGTPPRPPNGGFGWSGGSSPGPSGRPMGLPPGYRFSAAPNYAVHGYAPSTPQSSILNNPWFWMYMFSGHGGSSGNSPATGTAAKAVPAVPAPEQFEANCRAAAANADKPADVQVDPADCAELARLAFAKTKAEAEVLVPDEPAVQVEEYTGMALLGQILIWGIALMILVGGIGLMFGSRKSYT